jgi:hypothetical protein
MLGSISLVPPSARIETRAEPGVMSLDGVGRLLFHGKGPFPGTTVARVESPDDRGQANAGTEMIDAGAGRLSRNAGSSPARSW